MNITIRFFALSREIVGKSKLHHYVPDDSTLETVKQWLFETYPALKHIQMKFAVNKAYAAMDSVLQENDEIACIPPVGGG